MSPCILTATQFIEGQTTPFVHQDALFSINIKARNSWRFLKSAKMIMFFEVPAFSPPSPLFFFL